MDPCRAPGGGLDRRAGEGRGPRRFRLVTVALLTSCLVACGPVPIENRFLVPQSRLLDKVHLYIGSRGDGRVVLWPTRRAGWRALLRVDPCGPFFPGLTFAEAEERFGEPDERGGNVHGAYVAYRRDGVRFLIGSYMLGTGGIPFLLPENEAWYHQWVLEAHPVDPVVGAVFQPEAAAWIDGRRESVTIMGPDHPAVHAVMHGLRVDYLYPTPWAGCKGTMAR